MHCSRPFESSSAISPPDHLCIADFGLISALKRKEGTLTAETGSYRWMAPEVMRHEHYDHR